MRMSSRGLVTGTVILAAGASLVAGVHPAAGWQMNPVSFTVPAPELVGGSWLNTPGGQPLRLAGQRGKVVVLHFWTFG
jgi:hypothetical protein